MVVALIDGADVDSGAAWELGYAYARGKPIIALRTDYRGAEEGPVNIMIERSSDALVHVADPLNSETDALSALLRAVETLRIRTNQNGPTLRRLGTDEG